MSYAEIFSQHTKQSDTGKESFRFMINKFSKMIEINSVFTRRNGNTQKMRNVAMYYDNSSKTNEKKLQQKLCFDTVSINAVLRI